MSFSDSDKFVFVLLSDGHLTPVHYRELGPKEGFTYSKKVSWADATINNVPLDQTFRYEDEIEYIKDQQEGGQEQGFIVVNERRTTQNLVDEDKPCIYPKKWQNRLSKMAQQPMTLPQAKKKKKGHQRFPIKPKTDVRSAQDYSSADKFRELVDTKSPGILGDHIYTIRCKDDWLGDDDGDDGLPVKYSIENKTYCPPEHWLTPVVQWDKIWSHMDEISQGYRRDYVYVPEGELCPDSIIMGPAIYFFDYGFPSMAKRDKFWVTASIKNTCHTREMNDLSSLSKSSYLSRVERAYLENPSNETLKGYQDGWKLTQPEYEAYYRCMNDGCGTRMWKLSVMHRDHKQVWDKIPPQPHL